MNDYDKICDLNCLYQAHLKARSGKRHKTDVITFEARLTENLEKLHHKLKNQRIKTIKYYHFTIYEPKRREIYATNYESRVLMHAICDEILAPLFEKRLIYDNTACQKGKGTHFAIKRMTYFLAKYYRRYGVQGYALKCDIRKYFDEINHQILINKLKKVIVDEKVMQLLEIIIDSYHTKGKHGFGLPLGNQTSQWFALFYLDRMDRVIKEKLRVKYYLRYMDDFILIAQDKSLLKTWLLTIQSVVATERLELNHKTHIFPLKNGFLFLGFRFCLKPNGRIVRRLRTTSKIRMKQRLKKSRSLILLHSDSQSYRQTVMSYRGHLSHGTCYNLIRHF